MYIVPSILEVVHHIGENSTLRCGCLDISFCKNKKQKKKNATSTQNVPQETKSHTTDLVEKTWHCGSCKTNSFLTQRGSTAIICKFLSFYNYETGKDRRKKLLNANRTFFPPVFSGHE